MVSLLLHVGIVKYANMSLIQRDHLPFSWNGSHAEPTAKADFVYEPAN
jgi:hypothetical protein